MSSWSSYLFRGYRQSWQDHSDVVDLLETVSQRNSFTSNEEKKEMEDIVKRLRYRHPKTPPRTRSRVSEKEVDTNDDTLHLNVIDSMNNMLPSKPNSTIKIDSSSIPQGGLLRDFGGGYSSCGTSQGTDESGDVSLGTAIDADRRNL